MPVAPCPGPSPAPPRRRGTRIRGVLVALAAAAALAAAHGGASAQEPADADPRGLELFVGLRELLAHRCAGCHGAGSTEGGLDISTREKLLAGGDRGPAVVPHSAATSLLHRLAARLEEPHMPEEGAALTADELARLGAWIDAGAPYDRPLVSEDDRAPWTTRRIDPAAREAWPYRPLGSVAVPGVDGAPGPADGKGWCRTPIDRFILARLAEAGLEPAAEADRRTLLRRLSFDLTGLPATPEEIAAFVADPDPGAFERAVDGLLARPAFGERMAQDWLDAVRYAESFGYEQDYDRPHAFRYRDFVVGAFNDDLPFDTFLRWQLAGDELAPDVPAARMATGFLAAGAFPTQLTEKEFESARAAEIDDMVATVGTAMLGLTVGCARCHDHKFDPVPQADYYRLAATFTSTIRSNAEIAVSPERHAAALAAWQAEREAAEAERARAEATLPERFEGWLAAWKPDPAATANVWRQGSLVSAARQGGGGLEPLPDGSLVAKGDPSGDDTYTIVVDVPLDEIGSLRLDALADPSLPRGGPGRVAHGNFALSTITVAAAPLPAAAGAAPAAPPATPARLAGLPKRRRAIAQRMLASREETAPVTLHCRADVTELVALRKRLKAAGADPLPAFTDLVAVAAAGALVRHPVMGGCWAPDGRLVLPGPADLHVGIAVDTEAGLVVPVVRDVGRRSLAEVAAASRDLVARARAGGLVAADMEGGVFTVTNLGGFGVEAFTPIINLPQTAILGLGAIRPEPAVTEAADGTRTVAIREVMALSLTFDHCRVDGAPAARFLADLRAVLEAPQGLA